jgi:hypothetical protein
MGAGKSRRSDELFRNEEWRTHNNDVIERRSRLLDCSVLDLHGAPAAA